MAWLVSTVLSEEDKRYLKALALELAEIRKQLEQLGEALARLNDKQFLTMFNAGSKGDLTEKQVDNYHLALQKQVDGAENELQR